MTPAKTTNAVATYQGKDNRTFTTKQLAGACCMILSYNVRKDFERKFLTGQAGSPESIIIRVNTNNVVWQHKPRKYDTAHFIKHRVIIREQGSYAQELQNSGSKFYVYKKRRHWLWGDYEKQSGSREWEKKNLTKALIYRGNHRNYFGKAFIKMCDFLTSIGGEIEWNIH